MMGFFVSFLLVFFFFGQAFGTSPGVTSSEIILGMSNAQSGPAKALGIEYTKGFKAYFEYINRHGGIHGRKIKVIVYDDGYNPYRAIANTKKLIEKDKVFLLTGYVGTPTSKAVTPIVLKEHVPFFFPFTGAGFLRYPVKREIFNLRATYAMETEAMVSYLHDRLGLKKIAIFYQDDSFGRAGLKGLLKALKKRNLKLYAKATYPRNTVAVKMAAYKMAKLKPEAIVLVGAYKPCAAFIKLCKQLGLNNTLFINISFVGSKALLKELGRFGEGVLITQVVPFPWDTSVPVVSEYYRIMREVYGSDFEPGFVSLEGFISAKVLVEILKKANDLTREAVIQSAESLRNYDPGLGLKISFSPQNHQGLKKVWVTVIRQGRFELIR
jgi:ABC-type branched-subunit amino acid transport system substrate-binding protein